MTFSRRRNARQPRDSVAAIAPHGRAQDDEYIRPAYPRSDHCDGERFFNPDGTHPRGFRDLLKWQVSRTQVLWPKRVDHAVTPARLTVLGRREWAATFLGHATFLIQLAGLNVLTDPVFASRAGPFGLFGPKRVQPPALRLGELPRIDLVLVSHNHYDHLDLASLRWLAQHRRPRIVVPLGLKPWLESRGVDKVEDLDWWQSHFPGAGMEVVCTPARHWSSRLPWDRCRTLWGGFMVRTAAGRLFFAGDTGWGPHFAEVQARLGAPGCALLPIGAYEPRWFMEPVHMNPAESVRAHLALGARQSLAMHHRTFCLTDEGWGAPGRDLAAACQLQKVPADQFLIPVAGETVMVSLT